MAILFSSAALATLHPSHLFKSRASAGEACLGGVAFPPPIGCNILQGLAPNGPVLQPTSTRCQEALPDGRHTRATSGAVCDTMSVLCAVEALAQFEPLPQVPARVRTSQVPAAVPGLCRPRMSALGTGTEPTPRKCQLPEPAREPRAPSPKQTSLDNYLVKLMPPVLALHRRQFQPECTDRGGYLVPGVLCRSTLDSPSVSA